MKTNFTDISEEGSLLEDKKNAAAAYFYAGFTVFLWSSAFPGVKYALNWYSPGSLMLFRFLVASAAMLVIAYIKKARLPAKEDVPYAATGGVVGIFMYMLLFNAGTDLVKTGISSFIIATAPIFTMLFSAIFLKERLRALTVAGVAVSALGLVIIAVSQVREFSFNYGLALLLAASVCTSAYNIIQRKISFKYAPIECTSYSILFATALMLVFLPELIRDLPDAPLFANAVIVYMGVFPAALAYLSWNYALCKAKEITGVSNFLYLTPFLATTMAYLFLGESLSPYALAGGTAIIAGMILANYTPKAPKS